LVDQQIGLLQDKLKQMGLEGKTDIIVTCDHGFDYEPGAELLAPIEQAGVMPDEVVVDNEGGTTLIYIKDHPADKIARLAAKFQASETTNAIFVAAKRPANGILRCSPGAEKGFAPGTFALELVNDCFPTHGPDMIVTWHWDSALNPFGVAGTQLVPTRPGWSQPGGKTFSGHGALSPYTTHSTLIAVGPDFGQARTVDLPAGNLDIPATLLALEGVPVPASFQGRVLSESFQTNRPGGRPSKPSSKRFEAAAGSYCAELEVSYVGKEAYLNFARRCGAKK
jgi:arylsulfatase A-like enzyme